MVLRYRIVDDRDGRVIAEHAAARQALRSFGRHVRDPRVLARISVVRLDGARISGCGEADRRLAGARARRRAGAS